MSEAFLTGLVMGFFFGLFIYYAFISAIHYNTSMCVMTEQILNRISNEAYRKGHSFGVTIDKLVSDALYGFITIDLKGQQYFFMYPRKLLDIMIEKHNKAHGGFLTTVFTSFKAYKDAFTNKNKH